jgi:hypothetical protein
MEPDINEELLNMIKNKLEKFLEIKLKKEILDKI